MFIARCVEQQFSSTQSCSKGGCKKFPEIEAAIQNVTPSLLHASVKINNAVKRIFFSLKKKGGGTENE